VERFHVDEQVKLRQDIPEIGLRSGEIGRVCSTWCAPTDAYEVEFHAVGLCGTTRTLLLAHQIEQIEQTGPAQQGGTSGDLC
jgi:hypothetical protein